MLLNHLPTIPSSKKIELLALVEEQGLPALEWEALSDLAGKEYLDALHAFMVAAELGSYFACTGIAFLLEHGFAELPQNLQEAEDWHMQAVHDDHVYGLRAYVRFIDRHQGKYRANPLFTKEKLLRWRRLSANKGDLESMYLLFFDLIDIKPERALEFLHKAAEFEYPKAQYVLGQHYKWKEENRDLVELWWKRAAANGVEEARGELKCYFETTPEDYPKPETWHKDKVKSLDDLPHLHPYFAEQTLNKLDLSELAALAKFYDYDFRHIIYSHIPALSFDWQTILDEAFRLEGAELERALFSAKKTFKRELDALHAMSIDPDEPVVEESLNQEAINEIISHSESTLRDLMEQGPVIFFGYIQSIHDILTECDPDQKSRMSETLNAINRILYDGEDPPETSMDEILASIREILGEGEFADKAGEPEPQEETRPAQIDEATFAKAQDGDAQSQYQVGEWHNWALDDDDEPQAVQWYRKAALQGHGEALHRLGEVYLGRICHNVVEENPAKAIALFEESGRRGHADGYAQLAHTYEAGEYIEQDLDKAADYALQAAELGDGHTANDWAGKIMDEDRIFSGIDFDDNDSPITEPPRYKPNYPLVHKLLKLATEDERYDTGEAAFRLFKLYLLGQGVEQDVLTAKYWFDQAKEKGWYETKYYDARDNLTADDLIQIEQNLKANAGVLYVKGEISAAPEEIARLNEAVNVPQDEDQVMRILEGLEDTLQVPETVEAEPAPEEESNVISFEEAKQEAEAAAFMAKLKEQRKEAEWEDALGGRPNAA